MRVGRLLDVALRRLYCHLLLLKTLHENALRRQVVFNLAKRRKNRLSVVRHGFVVLSLVLPDRGSSQARVKECLGD